MLPTSVTIIVIFDSRVHVILWGCGLSPVVPIVPGHRIECLARHPLWMAGLDYRHGTGHGVGAFLNVHEGGARWMLQ